MIDNTPLSYLRCYLALRFLFAPGTRERRAIALHARIAAYHVRLA